MGGWEFTAALAAPHDLFLAQLLLPVCLWVPPCPSCPAEAPAHLGQEVPSIAMEKMLEILRKSLKCSIFPGLQAASGEKCFLGLR